VNRAPGLHPVAISADTRSMQLRFSDKLKRNFLIGRNARLDGGLGCPLQPKPPSSLRHFCQYLICAQLYLTYSVPTAEVGLSDAGHQCCRGWWYPWEKQSYILIVCSVFKSCGWCSLNWFWNSIYIKNSTQQCGVLLNNVAYNPYYSNYM